MPEETGPWWVQDQETGHKFVSYVQADHLNVLKDESPYRSDGTTLRPPEPAGTVQKISAAKKGSDK